jgi:hypothetical protein
VPREISDRWPNARLILRDTLRTLTPAARRGCGICSLPSQAGVCREASAAHTDPVEAPGAVRSHHDLHLVGLSDHHLIPNKSPYPTIPHPWATDTQTPNFGIHAYAPSAVADRRGQSGVLVSPGQSTTGGTGVGTVAPQGRFPLALHRGRQRVALPQVFTQTWRSRQPTKSANDFPELFLAQSPWPPAPIDLAKPFEDFFFKTTNPPRCAGNCWAVLLLQDGLSPAPTVIRREADNHREILQCRQN